MAKKVNKIGKEKVKKTAGARLSKFAGFVAILSALGYIAVYQLGAKGTVDRVFQMENFLLMLVGGLLGLTIGASKVKFGRILPVACYSVAVASHYVESAYPLADALTGVNFLGGNLTLAIVFAVAFTVTALLSILASFKE